MGRRIGKADSRPGEPYSSGARIGERLKYDESVRSGIAVVIAAVLFDDDENVVVAVGL